MYELLGGESRCSTSNVDLCGQIGDDIQYIVSTFLHLVADVCRECQRGDDIVCGFAGTSLVLPLVQVLCDIACAMLPVAVMNAADAEKTCVDGALNVEVNEEGFSGFLATSYIANLSVSDLCAMGLLTQNGQGAYMVSSIFTAAMKSMRQCISAISSLLRLNEKCGSYLAATLLQSQREGQPSRFAQIGTVFWRFGAVVVNSVALSGQGSVKSIASLNFSSLTSLAVDVSEGPEPNGVHRHLEAWLRCWREGLAIGGMIMRDILLLCTLGFDSSSACMMIKEGEKLKDDQVPGGMPLSVFLQGMCSPSMALQHQASDSASVQSSHVGACGSDSARSVDLFCPSVLSCRAPYTPCEPDCEVCTGVQSVISGGFQVGGLAHLSAVMPLVQDIAHVGVTAIARCLVAKPGKRDVILSMIGGNGVTDSEDAIISEGQGEWVGCAFDTVSTYLLLLMAVSTDNSVFAVSLNVPIVEALILGIGGTAAQPAAVKELLKSGGPWSGATEPVDLCVNVLTLLLADVAVGVRASEGNDSSGSMNDGDTSVTVRDAVADSCNIFSSDSIVSSMLAAVATGFRGIISWVDIIRGGDARQGVCVSPGSSSNANAKYIALQEPSSHLDHDSDGEGNDCDMVDDLVSAVGTMSVSSRVVAESLVVSNGMCPSTPESNTYGLVDKWSFLSGVHAISLLVPAPDAGRNEHDAESGNDVPCPPALAGLAALSAIFARSAVAHFLATGNFGPCTRSLPLFSRLLELSCASITGYVTLILNEGVLASLKVKQQLFGLQWMIWTAAWLATGPFVASSTLPSDGEDASSRCSRSDDSIAEAAEEEHVLLSLLEAQRTFVGGVAFLLDVLVDAAALSRASDVDEAEAGDAPIVDCVSWTVCYENAERVANCLVRRRGTRVQGKNALAVCVFAAVPCRWLACMLMDLWSRVVAPLVASETTGLLGECVSGALEQRRTFLLLESLDGDKVHGWAASKDVLRPLTGAGGRDEGGGRSTKRQGRKNKGKRKKRR